MSSRFLAQDKPILQGTPSALSALEDEEQTGGRTPLLERGSGILALCDNTMLHRWGFVGKSFQPFCCFVCSPMLEIIYVTSKM